MIALDLFKGILIGISNVMPGLSGATIAVVLNVYDRMLDFFSRIFTHPIKVLKETWALILGMLIGIAIALFGIIYLVEKFPVPTLMFLVGLIIGGIPKIHDQTKDTKPKILDIFIFIIMMLLIIIIPFFKTENVVTINNNLGVFFLLFFLGAVAASAMIIPGVSGSMVLLALGYYVYIMDKANNLVSAIIHFNYADFKTNFIIMFPFIIGIILGLVLASKLIKYLLNKYKITVYYAILGLLVASPFSVIYSMYTDEVIGPKIHESLVLSWILGALTLTLGAYFANYMSKLDEEVIKKNTN